MRTKRMPMPDDPAARLLIVDDEAAQMQALCDTLRDRGYETVGCTSGALALATMRETPFDLLLTDLMMPELDGIGLLRAALEIDPNLVGIIMTGAGTIATAVAALQSGALDYILKPFKLRDMLPVLERALTMRRLRMENMELHQHMRERTAQLEAANYALEQANQAKDRFLASMSHELRTPLNAIIGFTGTLLMGLPGPLTTNQEQQLRTIQTSSKLLLSLINDLLDLAKIESGNIELNLEPVICQEVIQEIAESLRPLAETKGIALSSALPDDAIVVRTDRRALSQILLNLVNNAIKFTERGNVQLELCQRQENRQLRTEISVTDSGIGIRPEDQAKLFQVFTQVNTAHLHRQEGTGLGLHLSQKLANLLGGQITVQSEYDRGSTFTLVIAES
jgi:signal transduction histidine kinase